MTGKRRRPGAATSPDIQDGATAIAGSSVRGCRCATMRSSQVRFGSTTRFTPPDSTLAHDRYDPRMRHALATITRRGPHVRHLSRFRGALLAATLSLTACSTPPSSPAPGPINHIVFVKLADPADAPALIADGDRLLRRIPGVRTYACGPHFDIGRTTIDADYDVALVITFDDRAGYENYIEHPDHVAYVTTWKPRTRWLRIHDMLATEKGS